MAKSLDKREMKESVTTLKPSKRRRREGFKYEKLLDGHIRILQVTGEFKRGGRRKFSTQLRSFHVEKLPYFIALSYAWPKAGVSTRSLQCNDQHITISTYLYTAIENLCPLDTACSFAIWIDAICIDQDNDTERNKQVSHMGPIYSLASQVIVWLGVNRLVEEHRYKIEYLAHWVKDLSDDEEEEHWYHVTRKPPFPNRGHAAMRAIRSILLSPWFRRLWVVQEVCLGRQVNVLCGRCFLPWHSLRVFFHWQLGVGYPLEQEEPGYVEAYSHGQAISDCRERHQAYNRKDEIIGDYFGLIATLNDLRSQKVLKPIDKVFGLIFLLPEGVRKHIVIDYSQENHYWKTYVYLTRALLKEVGGLAVLPYALSSNKAPSLPSWCPDWNTPFDAVSGDIMYTGRYSGVRKTPLVRFGDNLKHLQVQGFQIDRIVYSIIGPQIDPNSAGFGATWYAWQYQCLGTLKTWLGNDADPRSVPRVHLSNLTFGLWDANDEEGTAGHDPPAITETDWPEIYHCYRALVSHYEDIHPTYEDSLSKMSDKAYKFHMSLFNRESSYFFTQNGRVGRGNSEEQAGDCLVALYAAPCDFILRYEKGSDVATLIGEAYVDGCMDLGTTRSTSCGSDMWFTLA